MKAFSIFFTVLSLTTTMFASQPVSKAQVGLEVGRALFGEEFNLEQPTQIKLLGKDGCEIEVKMDSHNFHVWAQKGEDRAIMNAGTPSVLDVKQRRATRQVYFETRGVCLGGLIPGTASCDHELNLLRVTRDKAGKVTEISVQNRVDKLFQFS